MFRNYFNDFIKHRRFRNLRPALAALALSFGGALTTVPAQPPAGSLDATFNGSGRVIENLGTPDSVAGSIAVQPDGKIVVVGLAGAIDTQSTTPGSSDFVVLRYNADGTRDASFDGDGLVVTSLGAGEDGAGAVIVQPDGKILVAGAVNTKTPQGGIALARYNANGSLDASFGSGGTISMDAAEGQLVEERVEAMMLQPDGKILLVVNSVTENFLDDDVFVVRLNANGTRDTTFAGDGITTLPFALAGGAAQGLAGSDLALQPDGKILVVGTVGTSDRSDFFVWRLNANGTDDQTFAGRAATVALNQQNRAVSIFLQPDNKILVAGETFNASFRFDFAFARFNADGTLDASFDGDGKKAVPYDDSAFHVVLDFERQANGKLIAVGTTAGLSAPTDTKFAVTRLTADLALDAGFDGDGKTALDFGTGGDVAVAALVQPDGRILAAGSRETGDGTDDFELVTARFVGDEAAAPQRPEFDFDGDGRADFAVFRPAAQASWFFLRSGAGNSFGGADWGLGSDKPAPADYDGDGRTDIAVWRDEPGNPDRANFYILNSRDGSARVVQFGRTGDLPLAGDWDGDGRSDPAVYRPGTGGGQSRFFYRPSSQPGTDFIAIDWGIGGDRPVRGDFDGDGRQDAAVFRPSNGVWYIRESRSGTARYVNWGLASDRLVPADYDGDGKTDPAVFRGGTWYIRQSSNGAPRYAFWGLDSDKLVPADYDGDGRADPAVYRDGLWYLLSAAGSSSVYGFGQSADLPLPSVYQQQ